MSPTGEAERVTQELDPRLLSLMQPSFSVPDPDDENVPDPQFMWFLSEYGALPVDLAARLVGCSIDEIKQMVVQGVRLGWMRYREFPLERELWILLRQGGYRRAGKETGRAPLAAGLLAHRREVIEAHLLLREEKPDWTWTCESAFHEHDNSGLTIPDGVLSRGEVRWAIEVERSTKLSRRVSDKLVKLCADYDRVVCFASGLVRTQLAGLQSSGDFSKLEARPLPGEEPARPKWPSQRHPYEPPPRAQRALKTIIEDGVILEAQFHRLLEISPEEADAVLSELEDEGCIRRPTSGDHKGWIWCSHRGALRSGTGLKPLVPPSRGELVKRIVLTEVRLDVLKRWPGAEWITRRQLERGHSSKPAGIPRGAAEQGGRRCAVMVLESWQDPTKLVPRLRRWQKEYAGVLCYRAEKMAPWLERLIEIYELDWVEVRNLPKPPPSAPFRAVEDEWRTGREPYRPIGYEVSLLWLINTEGLISEMQLPRVLGCSPEVVDRLLAPLVEHGCVERSGGWIRCRGRGAKLSGTGTEAAITPSKRFLEQRFQLMEVRLSHHEPVSCEDWKTNRQLAQEKIEVGEGGPTNRWPNAAVRIDGRWHAVGLVFREFRRSKFVKHLLRWAAEYERVRCYCLEEDAGPFARFLEGRKLTSIEAMGLPKSSDADARSRQEAFEGSLVAKRKERELRDHHKILAQKEVAEAVRTGRLKKPDRCERCGEKVAKPKLQGHHDDYSRRLDVRWLCTKCHPIEDKARRECEARGRKAPAPSRRSEIKHTGKAGSADAPKRGP